MNIITIIIIVICVVISFIILGIVIGLIYLKKTEEPIEEKTDKEISEIKKP
jgi:hypothetical protein